MKKMILCGAAALTLMACTENTTGYRIDGTVADASLEGKMVILQRMDGMREITPTDTAFVTKGKFKFEGEQADAAAFLLVTEGGEEVGVPAMTFILENGRYKASVDTVPQISGSVTNDAFRAYQKADRVHSTAQMTIANSFQEMGQAGTLTEETEAELRNQYEAINTQKMELAKSYINANLNNVAGGLVFAQYAQMMTQEEQEAILATATEGFLTFKSVVTIKERLETLKRTAVGQPFVDIRMATPAGDTLALSDVVGQHKLVMVDFWATWCGPCRRDMPNLVALYKEYNKKGLEIVGVSLDRDGDSWRNYIAEQKLTWKQMSDLQHWNSEGAKAYAVNSIPHIMLIDQNGIIISRGLHGEELINEVKRLLQ